MIVPQIPPDSVPDMNGRECRKLLKMMNGWMVRYPVNWDQPSSQDFWYIMKDQYEGIEEFSSKIRNQIRKGLKNCSVRRISKDVLKASGYNVYREAFRHYDANQKPMSERAFNHMVDDLNEEQWELWGVFVKESGHLIAFSQVFIHDGVGEFKITKFHPDYLKMRPSEALFFSLTDHYLGERHFRYLHNGTRNLSHRTNIQHFLEDKFRFRKAYCDIKVCYARPLKYLVNLLYPFRAIIRSIPYTPFKQMNPLLLQEELNRNSRRYLLYRLQTGKLMQDEQHEDYDSEWFHPSLRQLKKHQGTVWMYWYWMLVTRGQYRIFYLKDRATQNIMHFSHVVPRFYKFPFMQMGSFQIVHSFTFPGYRKRGLFVEAMKVISKRYNSRSLYIMSRKDNINSLRAIEHSGAEFVSEICKTKWLGIYRTIH